MKFSFLVFFLYLFIYDILDSLPFSLTPSSPLFFPSSPLFFHPLRSFPPNVHAVNQGDGATVSTIPVLTKCRFTATQSIEMVVVIRDSSNVIRANLTSDAEANRILQVEYEAEGNQPGGTCNLTQADNSLEYYRVRKLSGCLKRLLDL